MSNLGIVGAVWQNREEMVVGVGVLGESIKMIIISSGR